MARPFTHWVCSQVFNNATQAEQCHISAADVIRLSEENLIIAAKTLNNREIHAGILIYLCQNQDKSLADIARLFAPVGVYILAVDLRRIGLDGVTCRQPWRDDPEEYRKSTNWAVFVTTMKEHVEMFYKMFGGSPEENLARLVSTGELTIAENDVECIKHKIDLFLERFNSSSETRADSYC